MINSEIYTGYGYADIYDDLWYFIQNNSRNIKGLRNLTGGSRGK
jgi:hypothetical protein